MGLIFTIIKLIIVLSVVAIIHEFGHFIFAKMFKMKVDEFSIGFGKALWQKKKGETTYSFRLILLGGYVAIDGEDKESDNDNAFYKCPAWKRIVVLLAGVTFNLILAVILFISVNLVYPAYTTTIADLSEESILYESGLRDGDVIQKINNKSVHVLNDIMLYSDLSKKDVNIEYLRDGKRYTVNVKNAVKTKGYIGVYFDETSMNDNNEILSKIKMVEPGRPANYSGLKAGDIITSVNGIEITTSKEVIDIIAINADKEIPITVLRNEKTVDIKITPMSYEYFDLELTNVETSKSNIALAWYKSLNTIENVVNSYIDLFKGKVKVTQLSGVVGMGEMISQATDFGEFVNMLALISLAVGVANILPFPPLDGGKIVLVIIEWITKKKVPMKVEYALSMAGFALLILLTILVTINDIIRVV